MGPSAPLSVDERQGIVVAAQSVFVKLRNLYKEIESTFLKYGFTAPSAGVIARDLSEKIEIAITQHCNTFTKGIGHCDLGRDGQPWEVKICKGGGLTINQSKQIAGENYIVVNYTADTKVSSVWVLWDARTEFFSARKPNTNARSLVKGLAEPNIEVLFSSSPTRTAGPKQRESQLDLGLKISAKAGLKNIKHQRAS